MKTSKKLTLLLCGASSLLLGAAGSAFAADDDKAVQVDQVIVTATKRAENVQDIPMSVSAFSGNFLEKVGIADFNDVAKLLPSVTISQSNNNRNTTIFVRGIGTSGTNPGIEGSVGIFLDGVYLPNAGPIQQGILDISTVEVLRGPQGTLYGRNTAVGAINITTRDPSSKEEGMIAGGAGNYDERHLNAYVGGPISDTLSGRLSAWSNSREGYEYNLYTGHQVNGTRQDGLRGKLLWKPNDWLTGRFIAYSVKIDSECCTPETLNPTGPGGIATAGFLTAAAATGHPFRNYNDHDHVVDDNYPGDDISRMWGYSGQFDAALGNHTLTSITAYNVYDDNIRQLAADGLPQDTATGSQKLVTKNTSEEIRIASPKDQTISYLGGLYIFNEKLSYNTRTSAGTNANRIVAPNRAITAGDTSRFFFDQESKAYALFGQATWNVTDRFRFNGGLRYSIDKKDADLIGFNEGTVSAGFAALFAPSPATHLNRSEHKTTWMAGVQYDLAPSVMVYFTAGTGYKTGGFNARSAPAGTPLTFDAENSKTYEAGIKSTLFDRKLLLNADVYRMDLDGFQESILNPLTGSGFIVGNAGNRRSDGVEADAQFRPTRELSFSGSVSYLDATYTDYPAGQCYAGKTANGSKPGTCSYTGLTPAQSPKWKWSLTAQYEKAIADSDKSWFVNADLSGIDDMYLEGTLDPRSFQSGYTLLGARIGLQSQDKGWKVSIWGKNLTDEAYFVQDATQPLAALVSGGGTATATGFVGWYGPPKTYGVEASFKF